MLTTNEKLIQLSSPLQKKRLFSRFFYLHFKLITNFRVLDSYLPDMWSLPKND